MAARDRGLRNPRHTFAMAAPARELRPLFMAPLRPGETVIGCNLRSRTMLNQMMHVASAVPVEVEYAVWKVSVRQLGAFFTDLFANDYEDATGANTDPATGVRIAPLPINTQGHQSQSPLQVRERGWAGEPGQADAEVSVQPAVAYAPYVSHAIWHIARMMYDVEYAQTLNAQAPVGGSYVGFLNSSVDMFQTPPKIARRLRTASNSALPINLSSDNATGITSVAQWAERLALVDNPNRTYGEYLKAFGIDPKRVAGMPEPVMMYRRVLKPYGSPQLIAIGGQASAIVNNANTQSPHARRGVSNTTPLNTGGGALTGVMMDAGGLCNFGTFVDETRGKRLFVDEPSFLVGTTCWWPYDFDIRSGSNFFDAVYMVNSGTWGDPTGGAVDERDFLISRILDAPTQNTNGEPAGSAIAFQNEDGATGTQVMNMLNLFLNGDTWANNPSEFAHFRGPFQASTADDLYTVVPPNTLDQVTRVNSIGEFKVGIASDLVLR